jgi:hypothetical protein
VSGRSPAAHGEVLRDTSDPGSGSMDWFFWEKITGLNPSFLMGKSMVSG